MVNYKEKTWKRIAILIKTGIMVGILLFIYFKLKDQQNFNEEVLMATKNALTNYQLLLAIVLFFMPLNWLLEALKWQILARPVKQLELKKAFTGVLAGLSMAFITPHGIGDYLGRVLTIQKEDRGRLVGAVLLGRLMQLTATLLFGTMGIFYLLGSTFTYIYLLLLICLIISGILLLTFRIKPKGKLLNKIAYYVSIVSTYSSKTLLQILALSCLRYIVFCIQLVIMLTSFVAIPLSLKIAGSTWIFLAKSILPTFNFLSDLGIREFSAIYFFDQFGTPLIPVLAASLLIWIINILLPTLVGIPFVYKLRIKL